MAFIVRRRTVDDLPLRARDRRRPEGAKLQWSSTGGV